MLKASLIVCKLFISNFSIKQLVNITEQINQTNSSENRKIKLLCNNVTSHFVQRE